MLGVLGLVDRLRLVQDQFLCRQRVCCFTVAVGEERGIRSDLRPVDRDHTGIDQPGLHTQTKDLAEQPAIAP